MKYQKTTAFSYIYIWKGEEIFINKEKIFNVIRKDNIIQVYDLSGFRFDPFFNVFVHKNNIFRWEVVGLLKFDEKIYYYFAVIPVWIDGKMTV